MLEDALGAGVMDELVSPHQALLHGDLAPGAEPIREICVSGFGVAGHGGILSEARESCQRYSTGGTEPSREIFLRFVHHPEKIVL
jgi:hypothetical protein